MQQSQSELIELAYVAMIVRDMESRILFWNERAVEVYGWSKADALGQVTHALLQTVFPESLAAVNSELERTGHWEGKLRHTRRDGSHLTVLSRQAIQRDAQGRPRAILEINLDITEQERARLALEESEAQTRRLAAEVAQQAKLLDEVLSASPDHFYMYDPDGRYLYANTSAANALGLPREAIVGRTWQELGFPPDLWRPFEGQRSRVFTTGEPETGEMILPLADGTHHFEYTLSPIHDSDHKVTSVVATVRDISLRKAAEEEVRRLNRELESRVRERTAQLEAANRELEAFSYSVSHDLRTPLRAIDGFSRILVEDYGGQLEGEAVEFLQLVRENTQQMSQLIDDLLAFSRLGRQEMRRQQVDVRETVLTAWKNLQPLVEGRQVEFTVDDAMAACEADPILLRQVFSNLLGNALKYTRTRPRAVIAVGCMDEKGQPVFYVRDNGIGFDMQYAHKLFGVFQRLHRAEEYEGTGVGLAIVQRIVHRHGGRVWAEGATDQGATFYFTFGDTCDG
jgi:PAS domain S-box-containing protein